jgi:hypothetical protein
MMPGKPRGWVNTARGKALAISLLEVFKVWVCWCEIVEDHVLDQKLKGGQHAVTLGAEGTRVMASGGATSFPEDL